MHLLTVVQFLKLKILIQRRPQEKKNTATRVPDLRFPCPRDSIFQMEGTALVIWFLLRQPWISMGWNFISLHSNESNGTFCPPPRTSAKALLKWKLFLRYTIWNKKAFHYVWSQFCNHGYTCVEKSGRRQWTALTGWIVDVFLLFSLLCLSLLSSALNMFVFCKKTSVKDFGSSKIHPAQIPGGHSVLIHWPCRWVRINEDGWMPKEQRHARCPQSLDGWLPSALAELWLQSSTRLAFCPCFSEPPTRSLSEEQLRQEWDVRDKLYGFCDQSKTGRPHP